MTANFEVKIRSVIVSQKLFNNYPEKRLFRHLIEHTTRQSKPDPTTLHVKTYMTESWVKWWRRRTLEITEQNINVICTSFEISRSCQSHVRWMDGWWSVVRMHLRLCSVLCVRRRCWRTVNHHHCAATVWCATPTNHPFQLNCNATYSL